MRHAVTYVDGTIDLAWYGQLFAPKGSSMTGDITPGYSTLQDELVSDIARAFPNLRIVFLIRDPVERFWSQLAMRIRHGRASFDPEDWAAIEAWAEGIASELRRATTPIATV